MKKRWTALLLSGVLLCTFGIQALATDSPEPSQTAGLRPSSVLYYGSVKEISTDEAGNMTRLWLESEKDGDYVMNVFPDTLWIDSGNRTQANPADLEVGDGIYVFRSPIATRSLPPQSRAIAIVRNVPQDAGCAQYLVVQEVLTGRDGAVQLTTDREETAILLDEATELSAYGSENVPALEEIQAGSRIMVWYEMDGLKTAQPLRGAYAMILPKEETPLKDGETLTIELDGQLTELTGRYENGVAMVPVAAVARAMGFEAVYSVDDRGGLVTVESETFAVYLRFGEEMMYGATRIPGAVGMTAPQRYGAAVYAVPPGTTWAPAKLFGMLGKTVTLDGTLLSIR